MRFLLTGATGYLGNHLFQELLLTGHEVVIAKRGNCPPHHGSLFSEHECIDVVSGELGAKLAAKNIDAIIHTATCYGRKGELFSEICEANLMLPLRLLDAASATGIHTFINADTVLHPQINAYARSKAQFRDWGRQYASDPHVRFINLKIDHMYGPGEDPTKFVTRIAKLCLENAQTIELTEGLQSRNFVHVSDVVSAYIAVLSSYKELPTGYLEFEVGTGNPTKIRTLVETIHQSTGSSTKLCFGVVPYRTYELMSSQLDTAALRALGWSPKMDLTAGLQELIAFEMDRRRQ